MLGAFNRNSPTTSLAWSISWADCGRPDPLLLHFPRAGDDLWTSCGSSHRPAVINNNYFRHTVGVAADLPYGLVGEMPRFFATTSGPKIDEYEKLITTIRSSNARIEWSGVISRDDGDHTGAFPGRCAAPSGVPWDLRKVDHYRVLRQISSGRGYRQRKATARPLSGCGIDEMRQS